MAILKKDPADVLDYGFDWSDWLKQADGTTDVVSTSTWTVTPTGLTTSSPFKDGEVTGVWLQGGVAGKKYTVTNRMETTSGRVVERSLTVHVEDR